MKISDIIGCLIIIPAVTMFWAFAGWVIVCCWRNARDRR